MHNTLEAWDVKTDRCILSSLLLSPVVPGTRWRVLYTRARIMRYTSNTSSRYTAGWRASPGNKRDLRAARYHTTTVCQYRVALFFQPPYTQRPFCDCTYGYNSAPGNKLNSDPRLVDCIVLVLIIHSFRVLESRGGGLLFFMVFFFIYYFLGTSFQIINWRVKKNIGLTFGWRYLSTSVLTLSYFLFWKLNFLNIWNFQIFPKFCL